MSKLIFKKLSEEDIENIFRASKGNVADYFYDFKTLTQAQMWVKGAIVKQNAGTKIEYVIYDNKDFIGMVSPRFLENGEVDIGMWVSVEYQGKGYGKRILTDLIDRLKKEGVKVVIYEADRNNSASIALAESVGFLLSHESGSSIIYKLKL